MLVYIVLVLGNKKVWWIKWLRINGNSPNMQYNACMYNLFFRTIEIVVHKMKTSNLRSKTHAAGAPAHTLLACLS